jgi:hypothetical protein
MANLTSVKLRHYHLVRHWTAVGGCLFGFFACVLGVVYFLTEEREFAVVGLLCLVALMGCRWLYANAYELLLDD